MSKYTHRVNGQAGNLIQFGTMIAPVVTELLRSAADGKLTADETDGAATFVKLVRRDRMQQLKGLHTADGRQLSPRLRAQIVRELQRLELVLRSGALARGRAHHRPLGCPSAESETSTTQQLAVPDRGRHAHC